VQYVLTTGWVEASGAAGRWLSEADYALSDPEFEARFKFNMAR
jgi:hypothetical protein